MKENRYSPKPSTSQAQRSQRSRSKSTSPDVAPSHKTEGNQQEQISTRISGTRSPSPSGSSEQISVTDNDTPRRQGNSRLLLNDQQSSPNVVFDVACCDGPVKFYRVLNENYAPPSSGSAIQRQRTCVDDDASDENNENGYPNDNAATENNHEDGNGNLTYTCSYCKHTFKSRYCYQKHARRHLLPTETNACGSAQHSGRRREVRLLDLNVQYYPCKICGSKFPSYYFVHKHRKLCHSNAEDAQSGSEETNPARSSNSSSSQKREKEKEIE